MDEEQSEITELWEAFLDAAPAGVAILDRNMRYLQASNRWKHDYGVEDQDLIGRSHYDVFPEIPDRWKEIHRRCLAGAEERCDADPFPRLDGGTDWVRWQIRPWHRRSGNIGGIIIFSEIITERVDAEQAVRDSESRYRALIEQAPEALLIFDLEARRVIHANRQAQRLFGCDADEITRRGIESFYDADQPDGRSLAESIAEHKRQAETGASLTFERRIRSIGGEEFFCEVTLVRLPTATGNLRRASFVDVTARKRAELLLRQEEAKYRGLVEQEISGIVIVDAEGRFAYLNPYFAKLAGRPAAELIGQPVLSVVPADDHAVVFENLSRQLRGEAGFVQLLSKLVTPSGEVRDILINATGSAWQGRPASTAIILDVTEQRRTTEALRLSEQKYRSTVNMAPIGIIHVGEDGRFLMVNDFFCQLLGYSRDELLGMTVVQVTDEDDQPATSATLARRPADGTRIGKLIKRYRHRDGHPIWAEVTFVGEAAPESGGRYGLGLINDITARKKAEQETERLAAQLQQAQKMEAIGQLTGGLAHDFNNLLAVVLGNLDFLKDMPGLEDDARILVDEAGEAALKGAELTRNLLAFARRQPLTPKLTDVVEVLQRSTKLLLRTLGEHVSLDLRVSERLWPVMIDAAQLESAMLNLAVNARDAMRGGGRLTVEANNVTLDADASQHNAEASPGDFVVVSVSDTGIGMSPEIAAKVFEPFFTTKGTEGSGLGLSMVHGFVKQSGGHTRLYSEPGRGTTVRIYLPRAQQKTGAARQTDTAPQALPRGDERVLVVEDNDALRRLGVRRLRDLGYQTIEARDAAEALAILRGDAAVDLLFTDIVMPGGMDGRELAAAARRLRPGLKVLFTSGFTAAAASAEDDGELRETLLTKPYRQDVLAQRLRAVIDGRAPTAAAPATRAQSDGTG
jgi:PAS domain S-box-containing protein